ncbi:hypothetical protein L198_06892 [Cryptococcus wingfieldii CBS 7118]|uniref:F-box domain-containing protein n=1 Tax=Cryptococcus wingfieldii CBS 7118 TaxID=1295528 RepID=A0A1E3IHQ0_9TREE|nr:hypothetical protein L198_06892 [Cryptococcus wingfieldii CBS 7118]ODN88127.1 hypothetical protein L198_06892 [Cryptococcus wingfieldii CBS 7118]
MIPTTSPNSPGSPLHEQTSYRVKRKYDDEEEDPPPPTPQPVEHARVSHNAQLLTPPNSSPSRPSAPQPDEPLPPLPLDILHYIIALADSETLQTIAGVSKMFQIKGERFSKKLVETAADC